MSKLKKLVKIRGFKFISNIYLHGDFLGFSFGGLLKSCTTVSATNEDMMVAHTLCLNKRLISVLSTMILTISSGMTMKVRVDIFRIFCKFLVFNPKKMN